MEAPTTVGNAIGGQGPTVIAIGVLFLILNTAAIATRCYTRARISKTFNYNDVFMITCMVTYASLIGLLIVAVYHGVGNHTAAAGLPNIGLCLKYVWCLELIYVVLTTIMKASIAITLQQWVTSKYQRSVLWLAVLLDITIGTITLFFGIFQCSPVDYQWNRVVKPDSTGVCYTDTYTKVGYALCGTTVAIDLLFLAMPWLMLPGRDITARLRKAIWFLYALALLASAANGARLHALVKLAHSSDALYDASGVFTWSVLEVSIGLIVAGLIELRPLMTKCNIHGFEKSDSPIDKVDAEAMPIRMASIDKNGNAVTQTSTRESEGSSRR